MGHGAVACDVSRVVSADRMHAPRDFELGPDAFRAHDPERGTCELPYGEIVAVVWARRATTLLTATTERKRHFSTGRALITGGLVVSKETVKKGLTETASHEQAVYLYRKSGEGHVLLREELLRYGGLEAAREPTRSQNFRVLVDLLRQRASGALFDARLATSPARTTPVPAGTPGAAALAGVDVSDLAAHLVVIGRLQDQL